MRQVRLTDSPGVSLISANRTCTVTFFPNGKFYLLVFFLILNNIQVGVKIQMHVLYLKSRFLFFSKTHMLKLN